jgi:hypothetical protein
MIYKRCLKIAVLFIHFSKLVTNQFHTHQFQINIFIMCVQYIIHELFKISLKKILYFVANKVPHIQYEL